MVLAMDFRMTEKSLPSSLAYVAVLFTALAIDLAFQLIHRWDELEAVALNAAFVAAVSFWWPTFASICKWHRRMEPSETDDPSDSD
jgi:hypothetical protein